MKRKPTHPGEFIKDFCLENMTIKEAAQRLNISRQALSNVLSARSALSAEMAIRVSKVFGGTPDVLLKMQNAYDIWQLDKEKSNEFKKLKPARKTEIRA